MVQSPGGVRFWMGDAGVACALAAIAATLSFLLGTLLPPIVFDEVDMYFGADINRVYDYMTGQERFAHFRSTVHPIFSFLAFPPTRSLMGAGFSPIVSAQIVVALSAAVTTATLYAFGRCARLGRLDAALLCALFVSSASFVFWWSVPETFPFGGMSVALVFLVAIIPHAPTLVQVLTSALSLSITTTNWAAALIAAVLGRGLGVAIRVSASAFALVTVLAVWQKAYVPTARFFFSPAAVIGEMRFVPLLNAEAYSVSVPERLASFFLAPWVAPAARFSAEQGIRPAHFDYGPAGLAALLALAAIAVMTLRACMHPGEMRRMLPMLGGFLLFQFLLHMVYGDEPFVYAAHFMPALICVAAVGFRGRWPVAFRAAVGVFVICALYQNVSVFREVAARLAAV